MFFAWRAARVEENARSKRLNEMTKTRLDLAVKDQRERKDTIGKIMGAVLEDMTKSSRDRIEKYRREPYDEDDEGATTLEEARERGDWLFIFEAARATHLHNTGAADGVLMYERKEMEGYVDIRTYSTAWYDEELTFLEDRYDKVYVVAYQVTAVYPRYIKAYCPTYDEFWQVSTGPNKLDVYGCYAYGWRTNLDETMVLVTPELCRRYPALISPDVGTRERVLQHHFPELRKPVGELGRTRGGKRTGVVASQSTTGKGVSTLETTQDGALTALKTA